MKKTNKGFSLVELIIVIAIMAILIGVLAPQYIKYVEKSRVSADKDQCDTLKNALQTAATDEDYYDLLESGYGAQIDSSGVSVIGDAKGGVKSALSEYFSAYTKSALKSKAFKATQSGTYKVWLVTSSGSTAFKISENFQPGQVK